MSESNTQAEEVFAHEYLWRSSTALAKRLDGDAEDTHHLQLPALLTTILAFEAFVNFAGFVLLPKRWKDEKTSFKGRGINGKLEEIVARLPGFEWKKGENPYQNIQSLLKFRDLSAHAKVDLAEYKTDQSGGPSRFLFESEWEKFLSIENIHHARENVSEFCQSLTVAMREVDDHYHLGFDAFKGPLASGERRV